MIGCLTKGHNEITLNNTVRRNFLNDVSDTDSESDYSDLSKDIFSDGDSH